MWDRLIRIHPEFAGRKYEAWAYGDDADRLAKLTLDGVKTATASAHALYAVEGAPLPRRGDLNIILNAQGDAVCVTRTISVSILPFSEVSARHAWMEGEGDRSLSHWRRVHEAFFSTELSAMGLRFSMDMPVVCEEFERVYPPMN